MAEEYDINDLEKAEYLVGRIEKGVIDLLGSSLNECNIVFSAKRIRHTKKHEHKFDCYEDYKTSIESAPKIIKSPEYVGLHPDKNSIRYVCSWKSVKLILLVAVGLDGNDVQWVKSMYPISEDKLKMYLSSGQLVKYSE